MTPYEYWCVMIGHNSKLLYEKRHIRQICYGIYSLGTSATDRVSPERYWPIEGDEDSGPNEEWMKEMVKKVMGKTF